MSVYDDYASFEPYPPVWSYGRVIDQYVMSQFESEQNFAGLVSSIEISRIGFQSAWSVQFGRYKRNKIILNLIKPTMKCSFVLREEGGVMTQFIWRGW